MIAILVGLYMSLWFILAAIRHRNDVADIAWGLGFVLIAVTCFLVNNDHIIAAPLVLLMVAFWGIRLAVHIGERHIGGTGEDSRYASWRAEWGRYFLLRSYLQVFLLQGLFMVAIALPIIFALSTFGDPAVEAQLVPWTTVAMIAGGVIWLVGFFFESVADIQLKDFLKNPVNAGLVLMTGLWKYSRHPNYFGEVMMWWGMWIAILPYVGYAGAWWTVLGPIAITVLITKVSGIPLIEKGYVGNPAYDAYKKTTNAFFPAPPKSAPQMDA